MTCIRRYNYALPSPSRGRTHCFENYLSFRYCQYAGLRYLYPIPFRRRTASPRPEPFTRLSLLAVGERKQSAEDSILTQATR
jgi:hypothetical protein